MLDRRGKCKAKSHIYDPVVQAWCREIIADFPNYFSARTFRDKISLKLGSNGYIRSNCKIGRSVATFYLHVLGMKLACPKKGIYKDGHERADTVEARKAYTAILNSFKDRERCYGGDYLQNEIPPKDTVSPEVIRIYHDECIYASHEGAMSLWVPNDQDPKYKKPRGASSSYVLRLHLLLPRHDESIRQRNRRLPSLYFNRVI